MNPYAELLDCAAGLSRDWPRLLSEAVDEISRWDDETSFDDVLDSWWKVAVRAAGYNHAADRLSVAVVMAGSLVPAPASDAPFSTKQCARRAGKMSFRTYLAVHGREHEVTFPKGPAAFSPRITVAALGVPIDDIDDPALIHMEDYVNRPRSVMSQRLTDVLKSVARDDQASHGGANSYTETPATLLAAVMSKAIGNFLDWARSPSGVLRMCDEMAKPGSVVRRIAEASGPWSAADNKEFDRWLREMCNKLNRAAHPLLSFGASPFDPAARARLVEAVGPLAAAVDAVSCEIEMPASEPLAALSFGDSVYACRESRLVREAVGELRRIAQQAAPANGIVSAVEIEALSERLQEAPRHIYETPGPR